MIEAGLLNHRVTLQAKSVTRDPYGAETVTWTDVATVWAQCLPLTGREFLAARAEVSETLIKIRIRHRADITAKSRAVWQGRAYDIEAALDNGGRGEELMLMCKEVT